MKSGEKHNDTKKNPIPKNKQNKKCLDLYINEKQM